MSEQIFLSHRRKDAWYIARLLKFYIEDCGLTTFVDNEIDRSQRFSNALRDKIRNSSDFILIITPEIVSRVKESTDPTYVDHVFWEMKTAYECFKTSENPKLHVIAYNSQTAVDFSNLKLPEHYNQYAEAFDHFKNLTPREINIDKFESMSDTAILNDVKALMRHLNSKPLHTINREGIPSGYEVSDVEYTRLSHQSTLSYSHDKRIIEKIVSRLLSRKGYDGKGLLVLDVGCGHGKTGATYFSNSRVYEKVLGIDIDENSISSACSLKERDGRENFSYRQMDITSNDFNKELTQFRQNVIGNTKRKFDIIFCYQVLQHVSNREAVLSVLCDNLSEGGCIIVRGSDDAAKMFYSPSAPEEHSKLIEDTVNLLTTYLPRMADRYYGRKIYSELNKAGLRDVTVVPITTSTAGEHISDPNIAESTMKAMVRHAFEVSFKWRTDVLKPRPGDNEERKRELDEGNRKINDMVRTLRQYVYDGWYLETDFFGYGFNTTIDLWGEHDG